LTFMGFPGVRCSVRPQRGARVSAAAAYRHALATGFDRAFAVAVGIAVLTLVTAVTAIRVRRADLVGTQPGASGKSGRSPQGADASSYGTFRLDMDKRLDLGLHVAVPRPRTLASADGRASKEPRHVR
jgi:hypothetical protein